MRISNKALLIELLSGAQLIYLLAALVGGSLWVRSSVHQIVRTQIMGDNELIARQMSRLIHERQDISSVDFESAGWNELQTLIEDVTLPSDGYMCVANANDGKLICHPKMRSFPELRDFDIAARPITSDNGTDSIRQSLGSRTSADSGPITGLMGSGNQTEVVSVAKDSKIADEGVRDLAKLKLLRVIGLSETEVCDVSNPVLSGFQELRELALF